MPTPPLFFFFQLSKYLWLSSLTASFFYFQAGVTKSCTVRLDEKVYCIRDDSEWKDCPTGPAVSDLVIAIEKLYRSS